jgi:nucleoside phosphorylase
MPSADEYVIGWICALPLELAVGRAMLDEIHPSIQPSPSDHNNYIFGRVGNHNVILAGLPSGVYGLVSAATVATQMASSFKAIRFSLMVGIGGGVPSKDHDIRLGDIVVSRPNNYNGGVIQYDFGKQIQGQDFELIGTLNKPPLALLTGTSRLEAEHSAEPSKVSEFVKQAIQKWPALNDLCQHHGTQEDRLFISTYVHDSSQDSCALCDPKMQLVRSPRVTDEPQIHYGTIASGNQVMKDAGARDRLAQKHGIICFEMEAAGLMDVLPCLVIRGICDYADSHKNKKWQGYAAIAAAAYAKELLYVIRTPQISDMPTSFNIDQGM